MTPQEEAEARKLIAEMDSMLAELRRLLVITQAHIGASDRMLRELLDQPAQSGPAPQSPAKDSPFVARRKRRVVKFSKPGGAA